jgi:hypothetical protein
VVVRTLPTGRVMSCNRQSSEPDLVHDQIRFCQHQIAAITCGVKKRVDGSSNSADRITGINCRMRQSPTGTPFIFTRNSQAILTSSGVIALVCRAKVPAGTVEPFTQTGFACSLAGMPATTSHIVWTPSGQGTRTCSGKF